MLLSWLCGAWGHRCGWASDFTCPAAHASDFTCPAASASDFTCPATHSLTPLHRKQDCQELGEQSCAVYQLSGPLFPCRGHPRVHVEMPQAWVTAPGVLVTEMAVLSLAPREGQMRPDPCPTHCGGGSRRVHPLVDRYPEAGSPGQH